MEVVLGGTARRMGAGSLWKRGGVSTKPSAGLAGYRGVRSVGQGSCTLHASLSSERSWFQPCAGQVSSYGCSLHQSLWMPRSRNGQEQGAQQLPSCPRVQNSDWSVVHSSMTQTLWQTDPPKWLHGASRPTRCSYSGTFCLGGEAACTLSPQIRADVR